MIEANIVRFEKGIFFTEAGNLKSIYAKRKTRFKPWLKRRYLVIEREATTEVSNAVHGWCRDAMLVTEPAFLEIVKELRPENYKNLLARRKRLCLNKRYGPSAPSSQ